MKKLKWSEVVKKQAPATFLDRLVLLFIAWSEVVSPKNLKNFKDYCKEDDPTEFLCTLSGGPIFRYKYYKEKVYYLSLLPSPGFPGS